MHTSGVNVVNSTAKHFFYSFVLLRVLKQVEESEEALQKMKRVWMTVTSRFLSVFVVPKVPKGNGLAFVCSTSPFSR